MPPLLFWLAPCPALRSATSSVADRVTLARLVNMLSRRPLSALAIPSLTCSLLSNPSASAIAASFGSKRSNQRAGYAAAPFFGSLPALLSAPLHRRLPTV